MSQTSILKTDVTVSDMKVEEFSGDLLVCFLGQKKSGKIGKYPPVCCDSLQNSVDRGDFKGKEDETVLVYPNQAEKKQCRAGRILFLGTGKHDESSECDLRERYRQLGGRIAEFAGKLKAADIYLLLPEQRTGLGEAALAECLVEGILLGDYRFTRYKKDNPEEPPFTGIAGISLKLSKETKGVQAAVKRAVNCAVATREARDMANEPGNGWTPTSFASYAQNIAGHYGLKCTVLSKDRMKALRMGGIIGVNQGSDEAPKMVILEYRADRKKAQTLMLVGKGLTFDSGGVSLKPAAGMEEMKYDMCGGAAAVAAMRVVGEERPDINVVAIIPATDNMGGGSALKPGDIITHYGGTTSEIVNTDAEGRLILADSLAYGIEKFSPDAVVDLATLTGAVIIGLGHHRTGLLGNNQKLIDQICSAGEKVGEPLWQLPLDKEYVKQIDSDVADIKNTGGRPAGTITAAAYLQKFVGDTPWAHMDIAGTAWDFTKKNYIPKGPSGTGVRTLVELIRNWKSVV